MKVLIVTGGLVSAAERSLGDAARKALLQWRASEGAWLDLKVKLVLAESAVGCAVEGRLPWAPGEVKDLLSRRETLDLPELAEVVLGTALAREGIAYEAASVAELFAAPRRRARLLAGADAVFLSSTLLRDLGELETVLALFVGARRVVVGGPLATTLSREGRVPGGVDLLAVGYGEALVPGLAAWLRSGAPARDAVMKAPPPEGLSLDHLDTPDWALAARNRGLKGFKVVHYESVRGCPYRCAFCNYPFLFDDQRFRMKSARRIADDWCRYAAECGTQVVSCLDSLFTVPPKRLRELCALLVERGRPVRWLCYARADDLADEETVKAMAAAGCVQVQIGLESGDAGVLANMNKRSTPEANLAALANCRRHGITTVCTLVVGFPGETAGTLERTYRHLEQGRPDFHFLATFSTRAEGVPVLSEENRARFGLRTASNFRTVAPYWSHDTMDCLTAARHARALNRRLALGEVSLDAGAFYGGILSYRPEARPALLAFQRRVHAAGRLRRALFDRLNAAVDRRLAADSAAWLASEPRPREPLHA